MTSSFAKALLGKFDVLFLRGVKSTCFTDDLSEDGSPHASRLSSKNDEFSCVVDNCAGKPNASFTEEEASKGDDAKASSKNSLFPHVEGSGIASLGTISLL